LLRNFISGNYFIEAVFNSLPFLANDKTLQSRGCTWVSWVFMQSTTDSPKWMWVHCLWCKWNRVNPGYKRHSRVHWLCLRRVIFVKTILSVGAR
jgi:hypothetical protein